MRFKVVGLAVCALTCVAIASSITETTRSPSLSESASTKMAELFSPASVAQSSCGAGGQARQSFLRQALMSVAISPAQAAISQVDGKALPPLYHDLGTLTYAVTSDVALAQAYFDQGLKFVYAFNHSEAIRSFQAAQKLDPMCALCAWGEAYALGPNINAAMSADVLGQAMEAVQRAQEMAGQASPREQALIEALAVRYGEDAVRRPSPYNDAFATAMLSVQQDYPQDTEIALITADAIMNESPWQYWESDGATSAGRMERAVKLVEGILAANPLHPGAIHSYIHIVEASTTPERAEPYADQLHGLMPGAGHIVHMPSHIYYRIGRYLDSLETNINAVAVDEAYFQRPEAIKGGMYQYGYYPHNVHFVLVSAQMAGDRETTLKFAKKLDELLPMDMVNTAPWVQPVKVSPLFAYAQFGGHRQIMMLPDPGTDSPYVKAMWHYARAVSLAKNGEQDSALEEVDAIAELSDRANFRAMIRGGVPAPALLSIAQQVAMGRIAQSNKDVDAAIQHFEAAVSLQDTVNYMEPPYWYYPVRQSLGAAYVMAGRYNEAEQTLKASLMETPNNGLALYGLASLYNSTGDIAAAEMTQGLLLDAWAGRDEDLSLNDL